MMVFRACLMTTKGIEYPLITLQLIDARNRLIQNKLLRLRELLLRRDELDAALMQQTLDLDKLMSAAQRSLKTVVQTRKDELLDLRKILMNNAEAQAGGNPVGC